MRIKTFECDVSVVIIVYLWFGVHISLRNSCATRQLASHTLYFYFVCAPQFVGFLSLNVMFNIKAIRNAPPMTFIQKKNELSSVYFDNFLPIGHNRTIWMNWSFLCTVRRNHNDWINRHDDNFEVKLSETNLVHEMCVSKYTLKSGKMTRHILWYILHEIRKR